MIERAKPVIENTLSALGYELVDIEYKNLYGQKHLIVYVASERGISLDDCEIVSNALDKPLDDLDPTAGVPYCLDVSSPGLDRPFKTRRDYERNYGKSVEIKLYAPLSGTKDKLIVGKLVSYDDDSVAIETADGKTLSVKNSAAALVRPHIEF